MWVQNLDPYERNRGVNVDMGPRFGPISTPGQKIPPSPYTEPRYPEQSAESVFSGHFVPQESAKPFNFPWPTEQQSGARRAFRARARRSARSVAAGGRIFRLRCRRSANFEQATNVFGPPVLPVCNFSTDQERFWTFSAAGLLFFADQERFRGFSADDLQFLSRPPAFLGL